MNLTYLRYPAMVLAIVVSLCSGSLLVAAQPNVIIVMADDQGYGDLGCYGNPILKTPNLDRLRQQSVSFSDFHVAPMCTPTRGMLMTGVDAFKNGATGVAAGMTALRTDLPIAPQMFMSNGYRTALFGKWHLGDGYPFRPQDRGFEEVLSFNGSMIPVVANRMNDSYFNPTLLKNGKWEKCEGYITDILFERAMAWIEERAKEQKPFFLYLPTPTPHFPNQVADKYAKPYRGKSHKDSKAPPEFYGMIANLDENMGRLDSFLRKIDLHDNTILIYLSDNGTQSDAAYKLFNAGMRGKKISSFEGGHRVPLFVRWPAGQLLHGEVIKELATVQDILPTLIDLCELKGVHAKFDGISLAKPLRDAKETIPLRTIVNQYVVVWRDCTGKPWNNTCVMRGPWRMTSPKELYNIHSDPQQRTNLFNRHPNMVKQLTEDYKTWYATARRHHQRIQWLEAGGDAPNPMEFTSIDWMGTCTDTWQHARKQHHSRGYYNIRINETGTYTVSMRHWPAESGNTLERDIAKARLRISPPRGVKFDENNKETPVFDETLFLEVRQAGVFKVKLSAGVYEFAPDFLTKDDRFKKSALRLIVKRDE